MVLNLMFGATFLLLLLFIALCDKFDNDRWPVVCLVIDFVLLAVIIVLRSLCEFSSILNQPIFDEIS